MAKKAKKELTLEEKLQSALVADREQPYAVPENWVWMRLESVCTTKITDGTHQTPKYSDITNGMPFVSAKDITSEHINWNNIKYITKELHQELYKRVAPKNNDILLAKNGTTGVAALVKDDREFSIYVTIALVRPQTLCVSPNYLFRLINSPCSKEQFNQNLTGIGVPNLHLRDIRETKIPLPPLAEQERIVQRIESLFAKLDTAKELLEEALISFESRKSALLHQAFTGELTKTWREKHGVSMESWEERKLNDICDFKSGHPFDSKKYCNTGIQVLRMGNLYNAVLDLTRNPVFFQKSDVDDKIFQKSLIKKGEILLTLTGTKYKRDYGNAILFEGEEDLLLNQRIISLTPKSINTKYLLFVLRSEIFRDVFFSNETGGVNQGNVSVTFVKQMTIKVPIIPEQEEIVRILDAQLQKEEEAKAHIQHSLEHIEHMKKAILARAFRGELGTNNPEDGHALDLLKKILENE